MYGKLIDTFKTSPKLYESTDEKFWDDEHISKYLLKAHLSETSESASRKPDHINRSADWITSLPTTINKILDLGCGPGLYAEAFDNMGYRVTGIDFSRRSIAYAKESALKKRKHINYRYQDYLTINYKDEFDIITLIYCDFGVLSPEDRNVLLRKIHTALKPGGYFVMDVFSRNYYTEFEEDTTFKYEDNGFWLPKPHLCIQRNKRYENEHFLEQYVIVSERNLKTYNIWNHAFTKAELLNEFMSVGFEDIDFYGDVTGIPYSENGNTIAAVTKKL